VILFPAFFVEALMNLFRWDDVTEERLTEKFSRRYIFGKNVMIARIEMKQGCVVPNHNHEAEQMTTVFSGRMRFLVGGEEIIVGPGETLHIPSFVEHSAVALDDVEEVDVFSPIRHDWIEGRDNYLRAENPGKP
jgi:quercetin dioxygenase-like cupin family protein